MKDRSIASLFGWLALIGPHAWNGSSYNGLNNLTKSKGKLTPK